MKSLDVATKFIIHYKTQTYFELAVSIIYPLFDSFAKSSQFNIFSIQHEQAAGFAAESFARQSKDKVITLTMIINGSETTNLISGQVNTHELEVNRVIRQQAFEILNKKLLLHTIS